jgi:adenylate cyclase
VTRRGTEPLPEVGGNVADRAEGTLPVSRLGTGARARLRPLHQIAALFVALAVTGSLVGWIWNHRWSDTVTKRPRFSMIVLPFTNLDGDLDQEHFVDAITNDLTTELSRLGRGFVISRNTAATYRNKSADTKQIGRELGVRQEVSVGRATRSASLPS